MLKKFYAAPRNGGNFPLWMFFTRSSQILLSIIILGLDAFVIDQWSKNNKSTTNYNAFVTWFVGDTHWTAFAMFIKAAHFYHVYAELGLEVLLTIFWLTGFAGMASYVSKYDGFAGTLQSYLEEADETGLIKSTQRALDCCKAIAGLGALAFFICLANSVFLAVYCLRKNQSNNTTSRADNLAIGTTARHTSAFPMSTTSP
ncbi:hypothetical protein K469DRAFT_688148 [Zopfia rhizophila CBS 207.26]|uniref:MARVEL domain-containing protein n=1 Tax=Zopfia rhizophila CBS 207.26 TaxID=1314779 RepID=A0A6A6E2D1_9PEZI|nr:hypothetical protein K469DRAFT_688148 [Zopfia rhizophila CBS 207.26]